MNNKKIINTLPVSPGVYIFHDKLGKIIYIGKAVNLKRRVSSYFIGAHDAKTSILVSEIASIDNQPTASALEALILEANLIKQHQPIYNIKEKDDKSYLYVWISKEDYPRISFVRGTELHTIPEKSPTLFGPYTSGPSLRNAMDTIRKIIPYRTCRKMPKKRCLYGVLGLCDAPCESGIAPSDYQKQITDIKQILKGQTASVINSLKTAMRQASKEKNFELARQLRDRVFGLQHIKDISVIAKDEPMTIYRRIEGYDISNIQGVMATGSMVVFADGVSEKSEYRKFKIKSISGANDTAMLGEVLTRRLRHKEWPMPDLIVVDGGEGQVNSAAKALASAGLNSIPLVAIAKGPGRRRDDFRFRGRVPERNLRLFKQVRDEAHRFAIGYYRKLHRDLISKIKSQRSK